MPKFALSCPAMAQKILFLAANPIGTPQLRLDKEFRDIESALTQSKNREDFEIAAKWAVRTQDIQQALLNEGANIIHFSGHGDAQIAGDQSPADSRKITPVDKGSTLIGRLMVEDVQGKPQPLPPTALANLFKLFADQLDCVVLNACYSQDQAEAIAKHVPYVIGTKKAIGDQAAINFAVGFYKALGAGRPIDFAFNFGCNAIELEGLNEALTPVLLKGPERPQTNPSTERPNRSTDGQATKRNPMELINALARLPGPQFSQLVFVVNPPPGVVPTGVGQLKQAEELLSWARNDPNHSLAEIEAVLDEILVNPR
jgi:hypothetical protein